MNEQQTIQRCCEVLRAEGYADAAKYLNAWSNMPPDLRAAFPKPAEPIGEPGLVGRTVTDVEALAERLAKVEDRLTRLVTPSDNYGSILTRLDKIDGRLDTQSELRVRSNRTLDERIDKVAEIIGERVSGLVERQDEFERRTVFTLNEMQAVDLKGGYDSLGQALRGKVYSPDDSLTTPAFPTGGASTAEAVADAVPPVPRRGDRVRLEGAIADTDRAIPDGWYDVIGHSGGSDEPPSFQIEAATQFDFAKWVPWLYYDPKTLKEVRHARP